MSKFDAFFGTQKKAAVTLVMIAVVFLTIAIFWTAIKAALSAVLLIITMGLIFKVIFGGIIPKGGKKS